MKILVRKTNERKSDKKEITVYFDIDKYVFFGLAGGVVGTLVSWLVYVFFGSFGSDKSSPELTDPIPIAMMICIAVAAVCVIILAVKYGIAGGNGVERKKSKLPKGPNLKLAE